MTEKIELNKGEKIEKHSTSSDVKIYPFDEMNVDDWFTVETSKHGSVRQLAYAYGRKYQKRFTTAKKDDLITITRVE